jgi:hypothetical protein
MSVSPTLAVVGHGLAPFRMCLTPPESVTVLVAGLLLMHQLVSMT